MDGQISIAERGGLSIKILAGILIAVLLPLAAPMAIGALKISYLDKLFYSRFIYWGTVGALALYAYRTEGTKLLVWEERRSGWKFILASIGILYLLYLAVSFTSAIPTLLGWHDNREAIKKLTAVLKHKTALLIFIAFTAGVTEELIFRGYVLTRLSLLFDAPYMPVIISSVMFSALHYKYHSLQEYIFTFLIGVIFSVFYQRYRNIKPLIIVHFLIDLIAMLLVRLYYK